MPRHAISERAGRTALAALAAVLVAGAATAQVDLTSTQSTGTEKVKLTLRQQPKLQAEGAATFDVDGADAGTYVGTLMIDGDVDDSGRKPLFEMIDWATVETGIEAWIDAGIPGLAPSSAVVDTSKAKVSLSAKERGDLTVKLTVNAPVLVNGAIAGKLQVKSTLVEPRPPLCAGALFGGIEQFAGSVRGVGSVRYKDEPVTLALSPEVTPFDRMLGFTYTNPAATPNTVLTGSIDHTGKRPVIALDPASKVALEENLEDVIFDEAGIVATVTLGASKSTFKCGRDGTTLQFKYRADFTAVSVQGTATGKVTIQSKMAI